jgi:uncharacterized membrane protein
MNWINVATIVAVIVMVALGIYFFTWMSKSQRAAAEQYREQMSAAAAAEAREADAAGETHASEDSHDASAGAGLSAADRLKFEEQHRSSGSV